jgi:hypothetical protein
MFVIALAGCVSQPVFQSPVVSPLQPPSNLATPTVMPTETPLPTLVTCPSTTKQDSLAIETKIEGLGTEDFAEIELLPDTSVTAACLTAHGVVLPKVEVRNEERRINVVNIPDGSYKLMVHVRSGYFPPQGYLFKFSRADRKQSVVHYFVDSYL